MNSRKVKINKKENPKNKTQMMEDEMMNQEIEEMIEKIEKRDENEKIEKRLEKSENPHLPPNEIAKISLSTTNDDHFLM